MRSRVAFLCLAALVAGGCQRSHRKSIAVIPKATSHLFWVSVQAGSLAAGTDLGVDVLWNGPAIETEYDRQIQIVDSMIARRVDGIALAAADRVALVAPLDRAMAAGIPVTIFDSGLDSTNYITFVATNNVAAGEMGARKLGELLGGKGTVAVVLHAPGSRSTMEREEGFDRVMGREFPHIKIVARQYGMSDRAEGAGCRREHPDRESRPGRHFRFYRAQFHGHFAGPQSPRACRKGPLRGV